MCAAFVAESVHIPYDTSSLETRVKHLEAQVHEMDSVLTTYKDHFKDQRLFCKYMAEYMLHKFGFNIWLRLKMVKEAGDDKDEDFMPVDIPSVLTSQNPNNPSMAIQLASAFSKQATANPAIVSMSTRSTPSVSPTARVSKPVPVAISTSGGSMIMGRSIPTTSRRNTNPTLSSITDLEVRVPDFTGMAGGRPKVDPGDCEITVEKVVSLRPLCFFQPSVSLAEGVDSSAQIRPTNSGMNNSLPQKSLCTTPVVGPPSKKIKQSSPSSRTETDSLLQSKRGRDKCYNPKETSPVIVEPTGISTSITAKPTNGIVQIIDSALAEYSNPQEKKRIKVVGNMVEIPEIDISDLGEEIEETHPLEQDFDLPRFEGIVKPERKSIEIVHDYNDPNIDIKYESVCDELPLESRDSVEERRCDELNRKVVHASSCGTFEMSWLYFMKRNQLNKLPYAIFVKNDELRQWFEYLPNKIPENSRYRCRFCFRYLQKYGIPRTYWGPMESEQGQLKKTESENRIAIINHMKKKSHLEIMTNLRESGHPDVETIERFDRSMKRQLMETLIKY